MNRGIGCVAEDILNTCFRSPIAGIGRTVIALAQLSLILLTPPEYFLVTVGGIGIEQRCTDSFAYFSAYCLWDNYKITSYFLAAVLLIVATGLLPRWTALPHFWVSYSIAMVIGLPDGGESVASAITLFYTFASINDNRIWHWCASRDTSSNNEVLMGISWAGGWLIRIQMSLIYLWGSLSKLSVESWQDGTAVYYVSRMEYFGAAGLFDDTFRELLAVPLISLFATWGTILIEFLIAILLLVNNRKAGLFALIFCLILHIGIALMIGIVSFALIMIGGVTIAYSYSLRSNGQPIGNQPLKHVDQNLVN